jgi:hypothetical protein
MKYAFIHPSGSVLSYADFIDPPDQPNPVKGRWIPDSPPAFDASTQQLGLTLPVPSDAETMPYTVTDNDLASLQAVKSQELYSRYQVEIQKPVSYLTYIFAADSASQSTLSRSLNGMAGVAPTGFYWVAVDNTKVPMDFSEVQGLAAKMLEQGWAAFQILQDRKTAVLAATTPAGVAAVVW